MIIIPYYNIVIVPGISLYFQGEYFKEITQTTAQAGETVALLMLKENKPREQMQAEDFYPIGLTGTIEAVDQEGNVKIRTVGRVNIETIDVSADKIDVTLSNRQEVEDLTDEEAAKRFDHVREAFVHSIQNSPMGMIARNFIRQWDSLGEMVASLSDQMINSNDEKYQILASDTLSERTERIEQAIYQYLEADKVKKEAAAAQQSINEKAYREQAIRKQIEILQNQLDEMHPENVSDVRKFEKKIEEAQMNETAHAEAVKVLNRMKQEGQDSHEYGMLYEYLDFMTSLSWKKEEMPAVDLKEAEKILDVDHFGLDKVKQRIIQQLAVMTLNQKQSGSILLFVGAPGTGKTSIGQSIAKALGRSYVRVSLGGIRDEAEIRGHRRTYVGAMPGRIMDGIKRSGVSNPVVVLDEVDKLSRDYNGDPSSALLEVLDPEQNSTFTDHYMNVPYDLSDVLFVCTANTTDTIQEPLLNRMEVIQFPGYTASEKFQIAKRHLLPRAMEEMGLKKENLKISDATLRTIISDYTMEAGVRGLKKRLDTLCREAAVRLVKGKNKSISVTTGQLEKFLGLKPILHDHILEVKQPGVVTGLAWTQAGGDILFIEALFTKGKGNIIITGQLGDVMKESVQIAVSLVKSMYPEKAELFEKNDLHIHVPAGSVPKDGPSAGITLTTAIVSLVTQTAVSPEIAMTGEVSLRGCVMPIGGLPEKLMAAQRAGIKTVFIPKENENDLDEVAAEVKKNLKIIPVHMVSDVLEKTGLPSPGLFLDSDEE
ncbi:MAG: endopeptidase La [Lachnospiraceae bacterium]|nr:endopeptidase La [Lachnospiraceae bacterium]